MVFVRSIGLATALIAGIALAAPIKAQTSATLNVTARVIEECTVFSKRELVKRARELNDPGLIRRCSASVLSRVSQKTVKAGNLRGPLVVPVRSGNATAKLSKKCVSRSTIAGHTDVVLVTVSY
ncbi:MAG: hypothetical protein OEU92_18690 [Alphaproteobacteria bacterium]|nr:hypothetical protein [Alphaproteobacteria bacterium]